MMNTVLYGLSFNSGGIMKKLIIIALVLSLSIFSLFAGIIGIFPQKEYDPRYSYQSQDRIYNEKTLKEILKCFDNKDADSLINMFSETIKSEYDLKNQIKKAFEIYDGKSVSYEKIDDMGYTSMHTRDGICVEKSIGAYMINIKTNTNKLFTISFTKSVVDDDNPNNKGMTVICLDDEDFRHLAIIGYTKDSQITNGE